jgi:deoxycytidylate deaminase
MSIVLTGRAKQNGGCDQACRTTAARDEIAPAEGSITPATKRAKLWDSDYTSDIAATITPEASCHGPAAAKEESPSTAHCCGTSEQETKDLLLREAGYDVDSSAAVPKRTDYLTWDDYFMATTVLSSLRSKDPTNPSGCCIVDSRNRIIGIGYNGFPMHCSDDVLPWTPASSDTAFLHTCDPVSP